jgi:hypothetical protein
VSHSHKSTRIQSVCPFVKYTFPLKDGVFTPKLLMAARNVGQTQRALAICNTNVLLCPPCLAKGHTSHTFDFGNGGYFSWRF